MLYTFGQVWKTPHLGKCRFLFGSSPRKLKSLPRSIQDFKYLTELFCSRKRTWISHLLFPHEIPSFSFTTITCVRLNIYTRSLAFLVEASSRTDQNTFYPNALWLEKQEGKKGKKRKSWSLFLQHLYISTILSILFRIRDKAISLFHTNV